ncbi:TetR family transcriptional regulator [Leifsonia sp. Root227]|uniref:TetR/AcrR family transcriptional regulator n=1 Tax=unclassified Leifsonia TaxID=2663824 RepID=UPI0006FEEF71|nr:TetR/AcrR family transcriptional regulator [Leifsonia sp. Root227]KRC51741.1 TetR family transcriptional regulator [Leifsonia sp. Root227]
MTRREQIADAAVRLIAQQGIRAMTHRAVDVEAGLAAGSTSYYARTRYELTALVVDRLAAYTEEDVSVLVVPTVLSTEEATHVAVGFLDRLALREDAQAARFALLFELRDDEELRSRLTVGAPVRSRLNVAAQEVLTAAGISDAAAHASDLVGLVDALLMYRAARAAPVDARQVLGAYLRGLERTDTAGIRGDSH